MFILQSLNANFNPKRLERLIQDRIDNRNRNIEKGETDSSGKPLQEMSREEAIDEVVARFSERIFSREESMQTRLRDLQENHKGLWQKIKDFFKGWLDRVRKMLQQDTGFTKKELQIWDRLSDEIQKRLATMWGEGAADMARNLDLTEGVKLSEVRGTENAATEGGERYAIRETANGQFYVQADRQVLTGDDPELWGHQIENYINQTIRNGQDFVVPLRDGSHFLALTSRTAYKMKDRNVQSIRHNINKMLTNEQYHIKGIAATHIDELIQVALFDKYEPDMDGWHHTYMHSDP